MNNLVGESPPLEKRGAGGVPDLKQMQKICSSILFTLVLCLCAWPLWALPLTGTTLRLIPKTGDGQATPKTIQIAKKGDGLMLTWFSLGREKAAGEVYPTYKIKAARGVIEVDGINGKSGFFSPQLWTQGYVRLASSLPLWLDPVYLGLSGRDKMKLDPGFLSLDRMTLKAAPDTVSRSALYFQNEYKYYVQDGEINPNASVRGRDERELKLFLRDYFQVSLIAKSKIKLAINGRITEHPAKLIGNRYHHFVVLDDVLNPLVLAFHVNADGAPRIFKKSFLRLKRGFEFQVTQVKY